MDKEQLKELIQAVYDDYDFADFNLHFVNCVEPHKVYEIKNNRINNKLVDTTMLVSNIQVSDSQVREMMLYGVDVKEHFIRKLIEGTADKILTDIYKVNKRDWFYSHSSPVKIELSISNWEFHEERIDTGIAYGLRFEIA
jgi:hypothetical protein